MGSISTDYGYTPSGNSEGPVSQAFTWAYNGMGSFFQGQVDTAVQATREIATNALGDLASAEDAIPLSMTATAGSLSAASEGVAVIANNALSAALPAITGAYFINKGLNTISEGFSGKWVSVETKKKEEKDVMPNVKFVKENGNIVLKIIEDKKEKPTDGYKIGIPLSQKFVQIHTDNISKACTSTVTGGLKITVGTAFELGAIRKLFGLDFVEVEGESSWLTYGIDTLATIPNMVGSALVSSVQPSDNSGADLALAGGFGIAGLWTLSTAKFIGKGGWIDFSQKTWGEVINTKAMKNDAYKVAFGTTMCAMSILKATQALELK